MIVKVFVVWSISFLLCLKLFFLEENCSLILSGFFFASIMKSNCHVVNFELMGWQLMFKKFWSHSKIIILTPGNTVISKQKLNFKWLNRRYYQLVIRTTSYILNAAFFAPWVFRIIFTFSHGYGTSWIVQTR